MKKLYYLLSFVFVVFFAKATSYTVEVNNFSYTPNTLNVMVGDTIRFLWIAGNHPTVIENVDTFQMDGAPTADSLYIFTAHKPGSFNFKCLAHANMTGVINIALQPLQTAECSDIFISEYAEGSSNNKYFEIYNPTQNTIDLNNYTFYLLPNGGAITGITFSKLQKAKINRTIAPSGFVIVRNGSATNTAIVNSADTVRSTATNYNGDDALIIVNADNKLIDMVGNFGEDLPGTSGSWPVVGLNGTTGSTQNFTLVRVPSVKQGNMWSANTEWNVLALDDFSNIHAHTMDACVLGLDNSANDIFVHISPNPFNDILRVVSSENIVRVEVYNVLGSLVINEAVNNKNTTVATNELSAGKYMVKIVTEKGFKTKVLVK